MGAAHTCYTSGVGFKTAKHVRFIDLDNRTRWDYPNDSCHRHPSQQMNAPSDQGSAKTVDVSQSVRLDVSGANEEAELIYLPSLGTTHHPNYLPRRALYPKESRNTLKVQILRLCLQEEVKGVPGSISSFSQSLHDWSRQRHLCCRQLVLRQLSLAVAGGRSARMARFNEASKVRRAFALPV